MASPNKTVFWPKINQVDNSKVILEVIRAANLELQTQSSHKLQLKVRTLIQEDSLGQLDALLKAASEHNKSKSVALPSVPDIRRHHECSIKLSQKGFTYPLLDVIEKGNPFPVLVESGFADIASKECSSKSELEVCLSAIFHDDKVFKLVTSLLTIAET